ncbi:MAG: ACP S-malonyltransferase [Pseudomonadota bacterium]
MTRTAVVICPGRGTYGKEELGYLKRHHADRMALFSAFDAVCAEEDAKGVVELDAAERFSLATYTRGDVASPLIYAASFADAAALADDIEVVAVTGNSMGWYIALAVAGALSPVDGFRVVNTMGGLMQQHLIGGQLIYPFMEGDWQNAPEQRAALLQAVAEIDAEADCVLARSIELGGMLVLAGNEAGLARFEATQPKVQDRFPMRLPNHAAFHTALQQPVAEAGQEALAALDFGQPERPMIDGRGHVWWPQASDPDALRDYTLGHQVTEAYDFSAAIRAAAVEFAPDLFIVTGPGATLGGAVAQSLIRCQWRGMTSKATFQALQREAPLLVSMGMAEQRPWVTAA